MVMCEEDVTAINLPDLLAPGSTPNGFFTVTTNSFPPSTTIYEDGGFTPVVGSYTISYSVGQVGSSCNATASMTLTVNATPALDVPTSVCDAADLVVPAGATTSTDVDGNIVVTITSADGCSATATVQVIGTATVDLPTAPVSVCEGTIVDLNAFLGTSTTGGTWSGFQVQDTNEFDSNDLGGFLVTVTYSVGSGACAASGTMTISIDDTPDAGFSVPSPLCTTDDAFALIGAGTFSVNGTVATTFDPAAGAGSYTIVHTVGSGLCTATTTEVIEVFDGEIDAGWGVVDADGNTVTSNLFTFCDGDAAGEIVLVPTTMGGNFTCANGTFGTNADGNPVFQYDLGGAPSGSFAVTYDIPGSCGSSATKVIQVFASPEGTVFDPADETVCEGSDGENLEIAGRAFDIIIVWSDAESTDDASRLAEGAVGEDLSYDPNPLTETTTVWVGFENVAGCASPRTPYTWNVEPAIDLGADTSVVACNENTFNLLSVVDAPVAGGGANDPFFTFTQQGGTGSFMGVAPDVDDLNIVVNPGTSVTYDVTYTTENGCESDASTITVTNIPAINVVFVSTDPDYATGTYTATFSVAGGCGTYMSNGNPVGDEITVVGTIGSNVSITVSNTADCACQESDTATAPTPEAFTLTADVQTIDIEAQGSSVCLDVTANDAIPAGAVIAIVDAPTGGTASVNPSGCIDYTIVTAGCGPAVDSFTYSVTADGVTMVTTVVINTVCGTSNLAALVETVCDDDTGNFDAVISLFNIDAPLFYSFCEDPSTVFGVTLDGSFGFVTVGPIPSDQGEASSYCIQFEDINGNPVSISNETSGEADFTDGIISANSVSCVKTAIELVEFDGRTEAEGNLLYWATASEIDNDYFTIERSLDGFVFEAIQVTDSRGNSNAVQNYEEMDYTAPVGVSYYRLLTTDIDGKTEVASQVIALERTAGASFEVSVAPVPATDVITVTFNSVTTTTATVRILDIAGKLIATQNVQTIEGLNQLPMDIRSYAAGSYFLTVEKDAAIATTRFIKE